MTRSHTSEFNGLTIHTLENKNLRVSLAPEAGGKITSLVHLPSGREWLDGWSPLEKRRLWKATDGDDFETSSGSGIDECLPTVLPCKIEDRSIPDHGEIWSGRVPCEFSQTPHQTLTCSWTLNTLPLRFQRTLTLDGGRVLLHYQLENRVSQPTPFLWAWHPLFTLEESDQMSFEPRPTHCQDPDGGLHSWPSPDKYQDLSRGHLGKANPACAKVFLGPLEQGYAKISGPNSSLSLKWPAHLFPWAGIWITRGMWKGLHHWAIEPTNAPVDRLSDIDSSSPLHCLSSEETREWILEITIT